jgi:hypothetical protein
VSVFLSVAVSLARVRAVVEPVLPRITFGSFPTTPTKAMSVVSGRPWSMRTCFTPTLTSESVARKLVTLVSTFGGLNSTVADGFPSLDSTFRMQTTDSPPGPTVASIQLPETSGAAAGAGATSATTAIAKSTGRNMVRNSWGTAGAVGNVHRRSDL